MELVNDTYFSLLDLKENHNFIYQNIKEVFLYKKFLEVSFFLIYNPACLSAMHKNPSEGIMMKIPDNNPIRIREFCLYLCILIMLSKN